MCRDVVPVMNFLFADDSLILIKSNLQSVDPLKLVLYLYCVVSGQMVSVDKSSIFSALTQRWRLENKCVPH